MPDNPFPSLLIGHDEDDGEDEALLQLTAQEEAMLPGVLPGDELELLEPPSHSRPTEEDTLINPGDWSTHSPRRGGCDRASSEVLHSKKVMEGGAPSLGGKDLAAALPRQTVAAIQKRRALAQAQGRGWWKDRVWFFWLSLSFLWSVGTFVYAISFGDLEHLGTGSSADWVGTGLIQVVEHKLLIFVHIPLVVLLVSVVWLQVTWRYPRFAVYASLIGAPICLIGCATCLILHASMHTSAVLLLVVASLALVVAVIVSIKWVLTLNAHSVLLTSCFIVEGVTWLMYKRQGGARHKGALQRLMGSLDNIHLITSTLLVLRLFLQTSVIAGAIHLWSFPDPAPASAGAGFHTASLTYSPHLLLFSLIAAATWAQGFLEAVHRTTIAALVSSRYTAGAMKSPHALHATLSSARAGGSDQRANSLSLGEHVEHQAPDPHHQPPAAAAAALPVQGGACDFGSDASERSEKGGGGGGGVENSDAEGGGYSDSNTAAEAASVVGPPSAVECLLSVLESHGGALAKGSALLGYLESCRTVQVYLEGQGERGNAVVTEAVRRCPVMVHAVYVTPHAFVMLAQSSECSEALSFLGAAKATFKLFARVPEARVVSHLDAACASPFAAGAAGAGSAATLWLLHAAHARGEALEAVPVLVTYLLASSIFRHVASVGRHAACAASVCYIQELDRCRPGAPVRCSSILQNAVSACYEWLLARHTQAPASPAAGERIYTVSREAAHSADGV